MNEGESRVSMSKRFFWSMFKVAWLKSFIEKNIQYAFAKPGIWPVSSDLILSRITKPTSESPRKSINEIKTPKSSKTIRHFHLN